MSGKASSSHSSVGLNGSGALSHVYIRYPPIRCNIPGSRGLFYDDGNKLLISPASDQVNVMFGEIFILTTMKYFDFKLLHFIKLILVPCFLYTFRFSHGKLFPLPLVLFLHVIQLVKGLFYLFGIHWMENL